MTREERAERIMVLAHDLSHTDWSERRARVAAEIEEAEMDAYDEANKDFNWLQSAVAQIYCHFTDSKLSKWNYDPDMMISEIEDCQNQFWEKEIEKAKAEGLEEAARIADDEECVCTDEVNCHGSSRIAAKLRIRARELGK